MNLEGECDVLGIWFQRTEGAKFWMAVLTELKTRGVSDVLFFCVDGLTGFPKAIEATFPHATVQTCPVHQVRNSLKFVSYKDRKTVAAALRRIYTAANAEHAADKLQAFADKWDVRYPTISQSWIERWEQITPILAYPQDVRRVIQDRAPAPVCVHRQQHARVQRAQNERDRAVHRWPPRPAEPPIAATRSTSTSRHSGRSKGSGPLSAKPPN